MCIHIDILSLVPENLVFQWQFSPGKWRVKKHHQICGVAHFQTKPYLPSISMGHLYHGYVSHNQKVSG